MASTDRPALVRHVGDDLFVAISASGHAIAIDTSHETAPSPMELLLMALGSCTAVDVAGILKKKREQVSDYRIELRGERRQVHPRSFNRIEVHHIVTGKSVSAKAVAQAVALSETKYCSVAATLRPTAEIVSTFEIIEVTA